MATTSGLFDIGGGFFWWIRLGVAGVTSLGVICSQVGWFQPVDRDGQLTILNLYLEGFLSSLQDLVWTSVGWFE